MMTSVGRRPSSPVATAAAAAANHINKHTPERESRALAWRSGRQQWRAPFSDNSRVKLLQDRRQYPNAVQLYKCIYDTPLLSAFRHCQYVQTNFSQYIFGIAGFKVGAGSRPPSKPFIFYFSLMTDAYETTTQLSRTAAHCFS